MYCKLVKDNWFKMLDIPIIIMWAMLKNYALLFSFLFKEITKSETFALTKNSQCACVQFFTTDFFKSRLNKI